MASLQQDPSGNFHVCFRFNGRRFKRSLRTRLQRKADAAASHIEENIRLIESGRMDLPDDADIPTFLMSDGKRAKRPAPTSHLTIGNVFDQYRQSLPDGSLDPMTLEIAAIHIRHLKRHLGSSTRLQSLTPKHLQNYITTRSKAPGRNGKLTATTIKKELATLRTMWNWAIGQGHLKTEFPRRGLVFPRQSDKPPYQTWTQIQRQISDNNLTAAEQAALWECLYLTSAEIAEVLKFVKSESFYEFLHPMLAIAAHTGARRSELCRIQTADVDLPSRVIQIRERKRARARNTHRSIPISGTLATVLREWLDTKEKSRWLFPEDHRVTALRRKQNDEGCVTPYEAGYHLRQVLSGSKWEPLHGWHTFRHSFISNCASSGVDQRFIDQWVGHQTDEQRRRYRHLFPDSQQKAIDSVFH